MHTLDFNFFCKNVLDILLITQCCFFSGRGSEGVNLKKQKPLSATIAGKRYWRWFYEQTDTTDLRPHGVPKNTAGSWNEAGRQGCLPNAWLMEQLAGNTSSSSVGTAGHVGLSQPCSIRRGGSINPPVASCLQTAGYGTAEGLQQATRLSEGHCPGRHTEVRQEGIHPCAVSAEQPRPRGKLRDNSKSHLLCRG